MTSLEGVYWSTVVFFKGKSYGPGCKSVGGVPLEGTVGFQCLSSWLLKLLFRGGVMLR